MDKQNALNGKLIAHFGGILNFCIVKFVIFFPIVTHNNFAQTDLGELYQSIHFESFEQTIPAAAFAKSNLGRTPLFDVKGGIGQLI